MDSQKRKIIIKIYTTRKSYEFYPAAYDKKKLSIGSSIENDIWIPELEDFKYIISTQSANYIIEKVDDNEKVIEKVAVINERQPFTALGNGEIHLIRLNVAKKINSEFYTLIDVKNESKKTKRVGQITVGNETTSKNFISKIGRITKNLSVGHIYINCLELQLVSSQHIILYYNDFGEFWIEDQGATNGVYVNEFMITAEEGEKKHKQLSYGDIIDLFTVRIIFYESYLQVDTLLGTATVSGLKFCQPVNISEKDHIPLLKLPPRRRIPLPSKEIKLPTPPSETKNNRDFTRVLMYMMRPLIWLLLPLLGGIIDKNSAGGTGINITTSVMYTVGPMMMVVMFLKQGNRSKKENIEKFRRFREKLRNKTIEIDKAKKMQTEFFSKIHTSPEDNLRRAVYVDWRLFERRENDSDFLQVRIGQGKEQPNFEVTKPEEESLESKPDELVKELEEAFENNKDLMNYPITIDFKETSYIGIVGVYESRIMSALALIMQLVVHHSHNDLKIAIISPEDEMKSFHSIKFLPHIWMEGHQGRMLFSADNKNKQCDGLCYKEKRILDQTCKHCYREKYFTLLYEIFEEREKQYLDSDVTDKRFLPKYVFFVTDIELIKGSNSSDLSKYLLKDYSHLGVYTICLGEQKIDIPPSFNTVISTGFEKGHIDNNKGILQRFHLDVYLNENIEKIARALAPIKIESLDTDKNIPSYVTLLDLFNVNTVEELKLAETWNKQYFEPIPETPVAKIDEKKLLTLNITRKGIGPHGIVGGTTGSGKSEFLLSVILGMAIKCHPRRLGMIILDYKGGSTAEACKDLPHVQGIVTDLDKGVLTKRALAAIKYEIEYRENIFRDYSNQTGLRIEDLESYIDTVKEGPTIPYLLVIVDELAELKIRENAAMDILEDIARRGRSAGIYLLLTTQNPQGVINSQIQANVNYKICFRISKDNSRGIIGSPDAAYISDTTPGRGLIRVGTNELQVFQSAYTGADYQPVVSEAKAEVSTVYEIDIEGQKFPLYSNDKKEKRSVKKSQLNAVVDEVISTFKKENIEEINDLWLPILPNDILLQDIMGDVNYIENNWQYSDRLDINVLIGLSDDIRNRAYEPTFIDFAKERNHLVIYGPSYSGKTTLLNIIMTSLAIQNSPNVVNMNLFDFSTNPKTSIEKLPHMGNVFSGNNNEHVIEGISMLRKEIKNRSKRFKNSGVTNIDEYNLIHKKDKLPIIFIFIDNADAMGELKNKTIGDFEELFRTGIAHGFYIIITAHDRRVIPYEFRRYLEAHTICLWPEDIPSYELPRGFSMTSRAYGRGIYQGLEIQCALPVKVEVGEAFNLKLIEFFEQMNQQKKTYQILKSKTTSEMITKDELYNMANIKSDSMIPFAYDLTYKQVAYFDIETNPQILISYLSISKGKLAIIYIYNLIKEQSKLLDKRKTVVWTKESSWVSNLRDAENIKIKVFTKNSQNDFEEFMINLGKEQKNGKKNTIVLCDEWGELINMSSEKTYNLMSYLFKNEELVSNTLFITAAKSENIKKWRNSGCPHVTRAINKHYTLLADGKVNAHEWSNDLTAEKSELGNGEMYYLKSKKPSKIRLINKGEEK